MIDRNKVVKMYKSGATISAIMEKCNIKSTQTVYRIIRDAGITAGRSGIGSKRISISIDDEVSALIRSERPENLSRWVCDKIKKASK